MRSRASLALSIVPPRPALVPLLFAAQDLQHFGGLAGVSAEVAATAGGATFREKMLFTHQGLSGPAILQASSYWSIGESIAIDLQPGVDIAAVLREARARGHAANRAPGWPSTCPKVWLRAGRNCTFPPSQSQCGAIVKSIASPKGCIHGGGPGGTAGFDKAEVTAGGVNTSELSSKTFEAHKVPGLYFIGEAVDVTGQLGGFNFQWAWASGYSAGQYV